MLVVTSVVVSPPARPLGISSALLALAGQHAKASSAEFRVVMRARIIVNAAEGMSNEENARRCGVRPDTVRRARERALKATSAVAAFADAPRSGRPATIALVTRATVIKIACESRAPELNKARVRARMNEATAAKKRAVTAAKRARARAARAARQEREAARAKNAEKLLVARRARKEAVRSLKRSRRALEAANANTAVARRDVKRAAKATFTALSPVWTHAELQAALKRETGKSMSLSEIGRTLSCGGLRPHHVRMWLHSADPDFKPKVRAICDLYLNPPAGAVVLCVDEKTGMQARSDLHEAHVKGRRGILWREYEYRRHGTSTLIAAFDVRTGEVFGRCRRRTKDGIRRFLHELADLHATGDVYIVWDNLNVHSGPAIEAFNAAHGGRFHFVYTPRHASWMNQVEVWFSILQRRVLRHGSFASKADLEAAVMAFVARWNKVEHHPFRWRFRGDFAPRLPLAA